MIRFLQLRKTPFGALTAHFVRRLFASEEEQGNGGLGFGFGAILALVASPGAFASIVLLGKYSTLIAWMNGHPIDPIRRSPPDEYFFIVLSMTITGLVMVARWNRLFPDRRDFANLAVLPLPVRNIFWANLVALLGMALVFGVVVNGVSALFFPALVTASIGTLGVFLRIALAHAISVFAASLFSFFAVFALVGVLMFVLPRRLFRTVSLATRILLVVALLSEFLGNIWAQLLMTHGGSASGSFARFLPSFWFLGNYEAMAGIATPQMSTLACFAWLALVASVAIAGVAYALCYRRIFVRLPETFDMLASSRSFLRIRLPESMLQLLFRSPFERACSLFACKVLLRSESHLMFFGAYLGIGLVIVAQTAAGHGSKTMFALEIPLLVAFFVASGLRFAFDIPAVPEANWIFRSAACEPLPVPRRIARRLILLLAISWQLLLLLPVAWLQYGFRYAVLTTGFDICVTTIFTDMLLLRFQKIPFTCLTQLEIRQMMKRMLVGIFVVLGFVPIIAALGNSLLAKPGRLLVLAVIIAAICYALRKSGREADEFASQPQFEDLPGSGFELLKLS